MDGIDGLLQALSCRGAFEDLNGQLLQDLEPLCPGAILSRVASVAAGAGKRRLFIIGNYVKQRLLRPYHDGSMSILRRLVNDGTYDQTKPLRWVTGFKNVYSFDLKSATDRWPRMVIYSILSELFGHQVASAVVDTGLGMCELSLVPPLVRRDNIIIYSVGQPLGYHASWPLFTLSHHMIMWLAAERVYPKKVFRAYAILGDDVVIAYSKVADEYQRILSALEVEVSASKSLISKSGAFEFAKRFFVKRGKVDLSPVSLQSLLLCRTTLGLATVRNTYNIKNLNVLLRLGGAGYRVLAKPHHLLSGRWKRLAVYLGKPDTSSPLIFLVFHLGGDMPDNSSTDPRWSSGVGNW